MFYLILVTQQSKGMEKFVKKLSSLCGCHYKSEAARVLHGHTGGSCVLEEKGMKSYSFVTRVLRHLQAGALHTTFTSWQTHKQGAVHLSVTFYVDESMAQGTDSSPCLWASTGRTQKQPQSPGWNAENNFFFLTSWSRGTLKQHLGRGTWVGTQASSMLEGHQTCCFHLYFRDLHRCILPLGFALSHNRTGILSMFDRCLQIYQRPVFRSKHRCSACPTYKAKQQLIWCLCFSTP